MKRLFAGVAAALLAAAFSTQIKASAVSAEKAIVLDACTGRVLFEKNADSESLIASTTKIMTALIVCEQCNVLDRMAIPKEAVGIEGSSMYLREGEVLTIQELLYGLMLQSGNDAAVALAMYCAGTVEGFAELMNDKAHRLGLTQSHFVNPHGLDAPDHYSTARDLAFLAAYAMQNPIFSKTVSSKTVKIGERFLRNHNKLLWQFLGADGVKTGFTKAAGRILVSSALRDGRRIIAVTINAPDDWQDHQKLLQQGFSEFSAQTLISKEQCVGVRPIAGGTMGQVMLIAEEDFSFALRESERWSVRLPEPGFVYAPVCEGQSAGYAHVCVDGVPVGKVALVYGETVERKQDPQLPWWKRLFVGGNK